MLPAGRRRIPVLLGAATMIPIVVSAWLGLRLLEQDRAIERQRQRERLEVAAGRLALDIGRALQEIEDALGRDTAPTLSAYGLRADGISSPPDAPLLYQPVTPAADAFTHPALADAEAEEFRLGDLAAAAAGYRRIAESGRPAIRAAALVGLGRVLRKAGDRAGALRAYAELGRLGPVPVAGQPSGLVGLQGRCKVLEEAGDRDGVRQASAELATALDSGAFPLDRSTFDLYGDLLDRWGGRRPAPEAVARTDAAVELWRTWRRGDLTPRGRRLLWSGQEAFLAIWAGPPDLPSVWLASAAQLDERVRPLWISQRLDASLMDVDGRGLAADLAPTRAAGSVSLIPAETHLPFLLIVSAADGAEASDTGARRTVLTGSLGVALVLMLAAAYGLYRATTRELRLARQQSDFVSAVSHEFRTPLTSMRHLTELLVTRGSATSDERKAQYYELLSRETERLHRMVETLLGFGRIEAGAYAWRLEPVDAADLLRACVEEFRRESLADGRPLSCDVDEPLALIQADREALARALWNLLENAAKYSAPGSPIRAFARYQHPAVILGVTDEGVGIPPDEQHRIFQNFVRGSGATRAGVRGIGLGLTLVARIAEAHGGSVRLDSQPGRGSTFTLVIPCPAS